MKRNKENKRPWTYRFMSVVLACAMLFTSSGFQTLAQEASTEIQTESAEEIAARQAAQQAQEAAAQQAAAEEAARQAEAQAQAAAAQQAAEEEAARQAEAQAQAAAAQQAAEEESARKAAEAAAAQQAAEDANTARQQQQQAAVQSQGNYVSSVEQVPVIAGRLVLNVDAASTQEAGKAAKISVVYGLGSECTLGSVDTRLYVWNKNAAFPQFINGVYTDPISKRIFTLKTDEEGDTYISYSLKPGESFKQIFELTDTTVAAGGSVVFDVAICAMGQIPTDSQIQQTAGKVTYALPAEETQPVAGESQPATEEMQQAAGDSQPVTEESEQYVTIELPEEGTSDTSSTERADTNTSNGISAEESLIDIVLPGLEGEAETDAGTEEVIVWNDVFFEVIEGASVTVDSMDVTNDVAKAKNGTIIFNVAAEEGYEITEVLVDGTTPAETTENDGEYIIENISTDETIVTVLTEALETEEVELLEEIVEFVMPRMRLFGSASEDTKSYNILDSRNQTSFTVLVNGKEYDGKSQIDRDATIQVVLNYTYAAVNKPVEADATGHYYFPIPVTSGLELSESASSGEVVSGTDIVGTYKIQDGNVFIDYFPDWVKGKNTISGTFTFDYTASASTDTDKSKITIGDEDHIITFTSGLSGKKTYTVNPDGSLQFFIELTPTDADVKYVTVTDTLSGSLTFRKNTFQLVVGGVSTSLNNVEFSNNDKTATITIDEIKYGTTAVITYTVDPYFTDGATNGGNSATWGWNGAGDGTDTGAPGAGGSDHVEVKPDNNTLTKSSSNFMTNSNLGKNQIEYTIKVNEFGKDLVPDADTITLIDYLASNVVLLSDQLNRLKVVTASGTDITEQCVIDYDGSVLKITLPDGVSAIITYKVRVIGTVGTDTTVVNRVTLEGYPESKTEDTVKIERSSATAEGASKVVTIKKQDQFNASQAISGVTFELYKVTGSGAQKLTEDITADDGTLTFGGVDKEEGLLELDTLYYVKETAVPNGYILNDTPIYFILNATDSHKAEIDRVYKDVKYLTDGAAQFIIANLPEPEPTTTHFTAQKTVDGGSPNAGEVFTFGLKYLNYSPATNKTAYIPKDPSAVPVLAYNSTDKIAQNGMKECTNFVDGTVTFGEIQFEYEGTYFFEIWEKEDTSKTNFIFDGTRYQVEVKVERDGKTLKCTHVYKVNNASRSQIAFDNKRITGFTLQKQFSGTNVLDTDTEFTFRITAKKGTSAWNFSDITVKSNGTDYDTSKWSVKNNTLTVKLIVPTGSTQSPVITVDKVPLGATVTVQEDQKAGWTVVANNGSTGLTLQQSVSENGIVVQNRRDVVSIAVNKIWNTQGDSDAQNKIPEKLQLNLKAKVGETVKDPIRDLGIPAQKCTLEIQRDAWTGAFTDLPKYADQAGTQEITYSVEEVLPDDIKNNWVCTEQKTGNSITLTNTFKNVVSVSASKTWNDNNDQDGKRPASVTVTLYRKMADQSATKGIDYTTEIGIKYEKVAADAEGTLLTNPVALVSTNSNDKTAGWTTQTWEKLPKKWGMVSGSGEDLANTDIEYLVTESVTYDEGYEYTENVTTSGTNFIFQNSYTPKTKEIQVTKKWSDNDDQDGKRPTSVNVYLEAKVGNETITGTIGISNPKTITAAAGDTNDWVINAAKWENLPVYYDGQEITYTVSEATVTDYDTDPISAPAYNETNKIWEVKITNRHTPSIVEITATKKWNDASNEYGYRPTSINFQLYKKVGTSETEVVADGYRTLNATDPNYSGKDEWQVIWTGLPEYENGQKIQYSVKEVKISKDADGKDTIVPVSDSDMAPYTVSVQDSLTVTNTYQPGTTKVTATKVWDDGDDNDGIRPSSVEFILKAYINKEVGGRTEKTEVPVMFLNNAGGVYTFVPATESEYKVSVNEDTEWSKTWSDLAVRYRDRATNKSYNVTYEVTETAIDLGDEILPYTNPICSEDGNNNWTVINEREPERTEVSVLKIWDDNDNQDNARPDSLKVYLKAMFKDTADKTAVEHDYYYDYVKEETTGKWTAVRIDLSQGTKLTANAEGVWQKTWEDLPKYYKGEKIVWDVAEDTGAIEALGYKQTNKKYISTSKTFEFTNSRETEKISKQLIKYWLDKNQSEEYVRPNDEVTFRLSSKKWMKSEESGTYQWIESYEDANGTPYEVKTLALKDFTGNIWTCSWSNLEKYCGGKLIEYTVEEINVPTGYFSITENTADHTTICNIKTKVEISKVSLTDEEEISGATLQILDLSKPEAEQVIEEWITDTEKERSHIVEGLEPEKEYTLREVKAPTGYLLADDITFTVKADGTVTKVVMKDEPTEMKISKKDADGRTHLIGAKFKILDPDKDVVESWSSDGDVHLIKAKLDPGVEYTLVEETAPNGYNRAADITFTINDKGQVLVDNAPVVDNEIIVKDTLRKIKFAKVDALKDGNYISGAELEVHYKEGKDTVGDLVVTADGIPMKWTSGTEAKEFSGIKKGDYYLVEVSAPAGYLKAGKLEFSVEGEKDESDMEIQMVSLVNTLTEIKIKKSFWRGAEEPLTPVTCDAPAIFTIFDREGAVAVTAMDEKLENLEITYDTELVIKGLSEGDYILHEVSAPVGYTRAKDIPFTVSGDAVLSEPIEVKNCPTKVTISKTDIATGEELPGATLQVLYADTEEVAATIYYDKEDESTWDQLLQWESTDEPRVIEGLPAGEYILREKIAPDGYTVAKDILFTITDDLTVENKIVMEDKITEVSISKRKMLGISELPGAHLQVLDESGKVATTIYYKDDTTTPDEKLDWISGEAAKVFKGLRLGKYKLVEVKSPDGYALSDPIEFEVTADGYKVTEVVMRDDTTKVHISKMDVTNNKDLPGARLALKDSQGNIITEWTSTGKPKVIEGQLIAGETYTLTEIAAPVGYDLAKDITFTVNSDGEIQKVVMEDKVSDGKGSITVQKLVMMDGKYAAIDYTFYVALFADEACTQRVSNVKPLNVSGSYTASTVFTKLQYGTYYVAETDEEGNAISEGEFIEANQVIDGKAVLTPTEATAKSLILNHVKGFDKQYYYDGKITVDKRVLINGVEGNVNDTFYFALFVDPELTTMADAGVKSLRLNGQSRGTVTFSDLPYGEYYLAETDEDGYPVDDDFAYTVTISSYCKIDADTKDVLRTVTNSKTQNGSSSNSSESTTSGEGGKYTTGTKPVKTGDNTPFMMYLLIFGASAIVLLGLYGKKRKKKNNM